MTLAKITVLIAATLCFALDAPAQGTIIATLENFGITNGASPRAPLTLGRDGNCYGTTTSGGAHGYGTVFELTSSNTFLNLASFDGTNGDYSPAELWEDTNGNFHGVSYVGGIFSQGSIFEFTTNQEILLVHSFDGTNGSYPWGGLIQASNGNFYGTCSSGGFGYSGLNGYGGYGTIYMMTPGGVFTNLYLFTNGADGASPLASLVQGTNGNLYGTTYSGGTNGAGVVFEWDLDPGFRLDYTFSDAVGSAPQAPLFRGWDGNWYGTTTLGGGSAEAGTAFRLTPNNQLTVLHVFTEIGSDGGSPVGRFLRCGGDLYGTTYYGGSYSNGTLFVLCDYTKPIPRLRTLYSFRDMTDGAYVASGLTVNRWGFLVGTTLDSQRADGSLAGGTVYEIFKPPRLNRPMLMGGMYSFTCWDVQPGVVYLPQYSLSLPPPNWSNLGLTFTTTSNKLDVQVGATARDEYFRLEALSPWPLSYSF